MLRNASMIGNMGTAINMCKKSTYFESSKSMLRSVNVVWKLEDFSWRKEEIFCEILRDNCFSDVVPCNMVEIYWCSEVADWLHHLPDETGSKHF